MAPCRRLPPSEARRRSDALKHALHDGEWWAPLRTAAIRAAAASALGQIGTPDAAAVLQDASTNGGARRPLGRATAARAAVVSRRHGDRGADRLRQGYGEPADSLR